MKLAQVRKAEGIERIKVGNKGANEESLRRKQQRRRRKLRTPVEVAVRLLRKAPTAFGDGPGRSTSRAAAQSARRDGVTQPEELLPGLLLAEAEAEAEAEEGEGEGGARVSAGLLTRIRLLGAREHKGVRGNFG